MEPTLSPPTQLTFKVNRSNPELIPPSRPTPRGFKPVSDIDDQDGLRVQIPLIFFYRYDPSILANDPVKVIKESLAKTLVFYYPFAGRLREGRNRKLIVECTGEGVIFIEAEADVTLDQLGEQLQPPFPCFEELLYDVPGSSGIIGCPLVLFQVTRLKCGGIIFAARFNHVMCDAAGIFQFLTAMSELAHGNHAPSVLPIWMRHILNARDPPRITCTHHEYEKVPEKEEEVPFGKKTHRSFFFKLTEISALRKHVPLHLRSCSNFDILAACLWRCRTIALQRNNNDDMRLICIVSANRRFNPPLPLGYYGNCIAYSTVITTAGELCQNSIGYALELVRKAKSQVTEEYMRSVADLMVLKSRPWYTMVRSFLVSDVTRARFRELDFGWGKAVFGGPAKGHVASFQISAKNKHGEDGIIVTMCLPTPAMERFVKELGYWFKQHPTPGLSAL